VTAGSLRTPLALAVDTLWAFAAVALVVQFFGQDDGPAPSIVSVAAIVVGAFLLARGLQRNNEGTSDIRSAGVVASVLALLAVGVLTYAGAPWDFGWAGDLLSEPGRTIERAGHVIAGMLAMAVLWIRGVRLGSLPEYDFDGVLFSVSIGFLAVVVAALSAPDVQGDVSWGALAFAFSIVALVTLAVFNAPPRTRMTSMATGWPLALIVLGGAALAVALVAGALDRDALDVFAPLVAPLEAGGRALRDYVLAPFFWTIALPFRFFAWLLGLFAPDAQELPQLPRETPIDEPPEDGETPLWWRIVVAAGLTLAGVAIALIALLLLWQSFGRYMRRRDIDPTDQREDVEPASSLAQDLASMLGALGRRLRRAEQPPNAVAIRRLYFDVLSRAEADGVTRPPSATPLQFAPTLDAHFASQAPSEISAAFVESRYAERDIADDVVRRLREQWLEGTT